MAPIRRLPPELVDQIAAGEVIERPASALKELVENALDAGARRIEVQLEDGGRRLVRVLDDGSGIPAAELELAVSSHATSKLAGLEDLFRIRSLGFRGEALASMASVAELRLASRPPGAAEGAEIRVVGGRMEPVRPAALAPGTVVEVRHLFFNTPARRKFLGTAAGEARACAQALVRLALSAPAVGFRLEHQGRLLLEAPPAASVRERIADLFGQALAAELLEVAAEGAGVRLRGLVAPPHRTRGDAAHQFVALRVGGGEVARPVRDRVLAAAIKEGYRGLLMSGRHPVVFLELEVEPELVDVNVHPAKLEVRFRNQGEVFGLVVRALRQALLAHAEPAPLGARSAPQPAAPPPAVQLRAGAPARWQEASQRRPRGVAAALARGESSPVPAAALAPPLEALPAERPRPTGAGPALGSVAPARAGSALLEPAAAAAPSLQLASGYLLVESADGFEVIDPHALHERILYEQLRQRIASGSLEVQQLLVPAVLELEPAAAAAAEQARALLAQLGLVLEPFGPGRWAVQAYPVLLEGPGGRGLDLPALAAELIDLLADGRAPERPELFERVLATMACKAAVKLGERLRPAEIEALLARRALAERSHLCPHGRPSALRFTNRDLERHFKR
ncbi:MAG: DNA mismatch repair protein MutL [Planctomycetota bacterium]|nr:MAG: DNA mismatch repair protein MutL [Planctomycetota bacterium]